MNYNPSSEIAVRCENLTRHYGHVQAVKNLNLSIQRGAIFGFLGRNGAGKTTTIRLLTGLAHPTSGSAWIDGVETTNGNSTAREKFGYLPQDPSFYNWMTPQEYLNYVGRLFQMTAADRKQRIEEVLLQVGLQDASRRRIGGFSGGMHQRLGIAQAMIHRPPVLLLDEPTSALDPAGRHEVLELIDGMRGSVTVFLSSHILADVERVCDTIGVIHNGELLFVEKREELLEKYAVNAIRLEIETGSLPLRDTLQQSLEKQPWVSSIVMDGKDLKILVNNIPSAKKAILPLVVAAGVTLNHYEWVRPSLEEVFLQVSS
jgi:ABC-2 type transport system ATP-binding protein